MVTKIVIADADRAIAESIATRFTDPAFEIHLAYDGKAALELVLKIRPDLIIADALLPVLSGFEFCKSVRHNPATKDIPIIVTSANSSMEDSFLFLGVKDFVPKPLNMAQLDAKVSRRLELLKAMQMQRTKILFHGTNPLTLEEIRQLIGPVPQWEPAFAENAKELMAKAQDLAPDVIVIDLFMNDMHVDAAVAQLKKIPSLVNVEILTYYSPFSTSQAEIALQAKMIEVQYLKRISTEAGAREYLGPFNHANFLSLFNEYRKDLVG